MYKRYLLTRTNLTYACKLFTGKLVHVRVNIECVRYFISKYLPLNQYLSLLGYMVLCLLLVKSRSARIIIIGTKVQGISRNGISLQLTVPFVFIYFNCLTDKH